MISTDQLYKLSTAEFDLNNKASLINIKTLNVDTALNKSDRMNQYINAIHNPYLFRVGDTAVRVRYGKGDHRLQESVTNFLLSQ